MQADSLPISATINGIKDKENMVHIHNGTLLNHKKEIMPFAAIWMDLEIIILREVSQKEKDKYHMIWLTSGI